MAAEAPAQAVTDTRQLGLYEGWTPPPRPRSPGQGALAPSGVEGPLCAACRAREARYGFREDDQVVRRRTLCFECFRMEIDRRQRMAAQLARGWNAEQVSLPLADTLREVDLRRRRAQIAARHALGV